MWILWIHDPFFDLPTKPGFGFSQNRLTYDFMRIGWIWIVTSYYRKLHYLTREFRVKLHLKTDISHSSLRNSSDIGFRVQFNVEFPRQVMNFPIIWRHDSDSANTHKTISESIFWKSKSWFSWQIEKRITNP